MTTRFLFLILSVIWASALHAEPPPKPPGWVTEDEASFLRQATDKISANSQQLIGLTKELNSEIKSLRPGDHERSLSALVLLAKIMDTGNLQAMQGFFIAGWFTTSHDQKPNYTKMFAIHASAVNAELLRASEWLPDVSRRVSPEATRIANTASNLIRNSLSHFNDCLTMLEAKNLEIQGP